MLFWYQRLSLEYVRSSLQHLKILQWKLYSGRPPPRATPTWPSTLVFPVGRCKRVLCRPLHTSQTTFFKHCDFIIWNLWQCSNGCCSEQNKHGGEPLLGSDTDVSCLTITATDVDFFPELETKVDFFAGPLVWLREPIMALANTGFNLILVSSSRKDTNREKVTTLPLRFCPPTETNALAGNLDVY